MNKENLLKLAAHLRKPAEERLHPEFDLRLVNFVPDISSFGTKKGVMNCGTAGCAMGETPLVFPAVKFNPRYVQEFLFQGERYSHTGLAEALFAIPYQDAISLFNPGSKRWWANGRLYSDATPEQVAESIEQYVAAVEARNRE